MVSKSGFNPRLVIIEGKDKGKVIPLQKGTAVIGRSKGDVLIHDPRVSRSHIALHYDDKSGHLTFTDLKSLNGSIINGERQEAGELFDGDKLQLGNTLFDCQITPATPEASDPSFLRNPLKRKEPSRHLDEIPDFPPSRPEDIDPEEIAREDRERTSHGFIPKVQRAYLNLPRRTRVIALGAFLIVGLLLLPRAPNSGGTGDLAEKELDAVRTLATQGKMQEAIAKAIDLKEQNPKSAQALAILGNLYETDHKYELAISTYQKLKDLTPTDPVVHSRLIRLLMKAGLAKEAQESLIHLEKMVKDGPRSQSLFVELGRLFLEIKDLNESPEKILIIAKALQTEFAAEDTLGYRLEAQILLQQSRAEEALAAIAKGRKIDNTDEWLLENQAFAKLILKDNAGAAAALQEWTQLKPVASKPLLVMAYLKFNDKDDQGALQYLQKLIQITSNNPQDTHLPEALNLMGQVYLQENQVHEAEASFKQACELGFQQSCENELLKRSPTNTVPNK